MKNVIALLLIMVASLTGVVMAQSTVGGANTRTTPPNAVRGEISNSSYGNDANNPTNNAY